MMSICRLCYAETKTRNIDLYVFGSEGLTVCNPCEMEIVSFVRSMNSVSARVKMALMKTQNQTRETKERQ